MHRRWKIEKLIEDAETRRSRGSSSASSFQRVLPSGLFDIQLHNHNSRPIRSVSIVVERVYPKGVLFAKEAMRLASSESMKRFLLFDLGFADDAGDELEEPELRRLWKQR